MRIAIDVIPVNKFKTEDQISSRNANNKGKRHLKMRKCPSYKKTKL